MKSDINKIKLIELYLDGNMTKKELADFQKELEKNKNLQKEVELHRDIRKTFNTKGKEKLRLELNDYYNEYVKEKYKKRMIKILLPVISVAASIVIIMFIFIGRNTESIPSRKIITLDTASINKSPEYADSANFDSDIYKDSFNK